MEDTNIQTKKSFLSSKEIVKLARKFYKENFKKLWPLYILGGLGGMSFSYSSSNGGSTNNTTTAVLPNLNIPVWVWLLIGILLTVIFIFLFISKISLLKGISDTHKGQFVSIKDSYKKGVAIFWSFILIGIMTSLSCLGALALLIIPGIILSGYLFFSIYELIDKQKKGFQALLGSWALVRGYWWELVGKTIMIGLRILLIGLLYSLAILIPVLILVVPGMVFHIMALLIIGTIIGAIAFMFLIFAFLVPLGMIATFELYYNFCDVKGLEVADETLDKKRKSKLIISMIIGVIAGILIILVVLAMIVLVNVNKYMEKEKKLTQTTIQNENWQTYNSTADQFSVDFPNSPKFNSQDNIKIDNSSKTYSHHIYSSQNNYNIFAIEKFIYSYPIDVSNKDNTLKILLDALVGSDKNNQLVSSNYTYYFDYKADDFLIQNRDKFLKGRIIEAGQTPYELEYIYSPENYVDSDYQRFINSFKINSAE